ncbi:DUF2188 domain-containing protein [Glycomyces sp. L485]|uniref:DUF2188 domain-containing protein n=1 Tax=Glycomyces sp. L485 TaxID=2909235 RepID=UPI001F4B259B|nr:DUF2188 domain-containing protein [Glycomyces sp. L485]MCH7232757.1 DUF2188 domain-containing protein [Glycomyces sp. L485]
MPKPKSLETYHEGGQWKNKVIGNTRASSTSPTKKDAVSKGKTQAKDLGAEHVIAGRQRGPTRTRVGPPFGSIVTLRWSFILPNRKEFGR